MGIDGTVAMIVWSLILFLPAMVTNALPVLTRVLFRNKHPIDFYRNFIDGRRILGDGKTWEGFTLGLIGGSSLGLCYVFISKNALWFLYGFSMGLGALLGDLINAFVKRRLGMRGGAPFPPFDQIDYLLGSFFIIKWLGIDSLIDVSLDLWNLLVAISISLILHPMTNLIAYVFKIKDVPW
ncbi:MAG: CDP-2,3-bis-(O-geranylgeranyl)-sn-glycerol synthase [Sulfolobales archaeon]|nr:CDP-2,3-bis-(O-geranylgeranyl)-sn-glycerol synthase [Sulfolobales archaeon]MCX8185734.1 CDP-2,3-bis-(O-geranylgeranyl)-sn-glycerol synthase [Sulfolobales archaeon]MDW7970058.1 CDP-2,3-bis-(O-geranylgeranyl)-sn-glycerol synthase [Sulfolobales archaeon]